MLLKIWVTFHIDQQQFAKVELLEAQLGYSLLNISISDYLWL